MKTRLALLLIVKNEAHIILECLESVYKYINYWVISDTGSTDNTCQIIRDFFAKVNIPGELHQDEWRGFDYNRTLNFQHCEKGNAHKYANYMWVIDADDKPVGEFKISDKFNSDEGLLYYRSGNMKYLRPQIFRIGLNWEYEGVIHETAYALGKTRTSRTTIEGDYYIESRRLGDRTLNPLKYYKDGMVLWKDYDSVSAKLLELSQIPKLGEAQLRLKHKLNRLQLRYTFYMGQSFRDYGDIEYSKKWYSIRAKDESTTYDEETYQARFELANYILSENSEKRDRGEDVDDTEMVTAYEWSYMKYPFVAEPYYKLCTYFNKYKIFEKALLYSEKAYKIPFPKNAKMFVKSDIYEWKCAKEYGYALHKCGKYFESYNILERLLSERRVPTGEIVFIENIRNMNIGPKLYERVKIYPGNIISNIREGKKCACIIAFTTFTNTCASINSFLKCCKDIDMISKWVVYGKDPQPLFSKLYPFVEYVSTDAYDIYDNDNPYILHFRGNTLWVYMDEYFRRNIPQLEKYNAVICRFVSGEQVIPGYNECEIDISVPILFTKSLNDGDTILSQRVMSTFTID